MANFYESLKKVFKVVNFDMLLTKLQNDWYERHF